MNLFVILLILLHVSQHAFGVEVYEGEMSVLLLCQVDVSVSEKSTVVWSRDELKHSKVHIRQPNGDDYEDQNKLYMNRTSMRDDALQTGDLSLTLKKPTISDSGIYNCTVRRKGKVLNTTEVELLVTAPFPVWPWIVAGIVVPLLLLAAFVGAIIGLANKAMKDRLNEQLKVVEVTEGAESANLTCTTKAVLPEGVKVEWRRSVPKYMVVHTYENDINKPQEGYEGRTEMKKDLLKENSEGKKDLSLNLKNPQLDDGGVYICTVYKKEEIVRQKIVVLSVRETWIRTIRGLCTNNTAEQRPLKTKAEKKESRNKEEEAAAAGTEILMDDQSVI